MQLTLNDSVLSLTSGDHGSKIWTCMLGLHSCHSNYYQLIHKAKKETLPTALRTQALTALTRYFGMVGLVQCTW